MILGMSWLCGAKQTTDNLCRGSEEKIIIEKLQNGTNLFGNRKS